MRRYMHACWVVAALTGAAGAAVQPGVRTYELGPAGEIKNWLVLGYLPGSVPVATDRLHLRFTGNRVDAVMPPGDGAARILIDGQPPSALNLFRGTRPGTRRGWPPPAELMTYHMGTNMLEEAWELKFTHASGNGKKFRYAVSGSRTGPDGEGDSDTLFVSHSRRITINPDDFLLTMRDVDTNKTEVVSLERDARLLWHIQPCGFDVLRNIPLRPDEPGGDRYSVPYRYATLVDGLAPGDHELTLIPEGGRWFLVEAIEVHRPPLGLREAR